MEQDFLRIIVPVVVIGTLIAAAGLALLFLLFRTLGNPQAGKRRQLTLMLSLIAFIFVCCMALFVASFK